MSSEFVGCIVSVKCLDDLGIYQGRILDFNRQTMTLSKPFRNGVPHPLAQVVINAGDIESLRIISKEEIPVPAVKEPRASKISVKRPIAKRAGRSVSESTPPAASQACAAQIFTDERKKHPTEVASARVEASSNGKNGSADANPKVGQKKITQKQRWQARDEQAFGTPVDQSLNQDFDFETNLALFDKEAVWQEINSRKRNLLRQLENNGGKYRHDENVIESEPATYRQIVVPCVSDSEYVTDDGLVIPSVTLDLHRQLIGAADRLGISWERRVELLGRAGAEIILQLLGGAHRLSPKNAHQWPTVVALCGPHRSGAAGVNCARQLSSHGVKTIVHVENSENVSLLQELSLYKLTGNRVETRVEKLSSHVDLVIVALSEEHSSRSTCNLSKWVNNNRAPILAIEPPSSGTPGISSKFSLLGGLPLSHSPENGRLYLCNLALPDKVFAEAGIAYKSPFGPKFVIPLHLNNS